ncbi:response regulator transcription factor [Halocynthiibacter sp. C4]|uniref:response regulator n=1 Tax=Halocynthiibacter sp. C4 TaxID=2992758 RepID=UPI00237BD4B4|nr:response regulator transcription factor [Halocynthiibacter sp. C4]MDE0588862.1 response regulator transcription factor [Halocynthiibacter sp. C4]
MRLLIVDDHTMVLDLMSALFASEKDIDVSTAATYETALKTIETNNPFDLILLDFSMPGLVGLEGVSTVLKQARGCPVALMSGVANRDVAKLALEAGAVGFIPKTMQAKSLINAVRFMASGEVYVPNDFMNAPIDERREHPLARNLSEREYQVLKGLCKGLANKEIARDLELQEVTIKLHMKNLCRKIGANNRTHAAMIARDAGLF